MEKTLAGLESAAIRRYSSIGTFSTAATSSSLGWRPRCERRCAAGFGEHLGPLADQSRHPVETAQFVHHRSADADGAEGFEFDLATRIKLFDGIHEAQHAGGGKVIDLHHGRQLGF